MKYGYFILDSDIEESLDTYFPGSMIQNILLDVGHTKARWRTKVVTLYRNGEN